MKKSLFIFVVGAVLASGTALAGAVNVNTAESATISKTLGVDDYIAARIVAEREENGPFKAPEDLVKRVKGFNQKALEKNKDNIKL
jgi:competence protein ComEA